MEEEFEHSPEFEEWYERGSKPDEHSEYYNKWARRVR